MADARTEAPTIAGTPLPPGPRGLGFDRLLHRIRDGVGFYEHLYRTCGDIVYFRMLSNRFCVVFDPALFQEVFVTKKSSFEVGPIFTRSGLLNDPSSGLTAEGDELKRTRTLARASFRAKAMNGYGEIMIGQALQAQAGWRDGDTVDLDAEAQTLALDIATNTFFGSDMRVEPRVINDVLKAIEWSMALVLLPLGEWIRTLPLPQNRRCARTIGTLDKALHGAIAMPVARPGNAPTCCHIWCTPRTKTESTNPSTTRNSETCVSYCFSRGTKRRAPPLRGLFTISAAIPKHVNGWRKSWTRYWATGRRRRRTTGISRIRAPCWTKTYA